MTDVRYVLNRNDDVGVIHRNPREECNTDDALGATGIDELTATALLERGDFTRCAHCFKEEE